MQAIEPLTILGIESSCDETAAAVMHNGILKSNVIVSQLIHQGYGGVVPELASREHQMHITPVVSAALEQAQVKKEMLHAIGFTQGPGLLGPLLIGNCFAKSLAFALNIPLIGVNHIQAHVLANFIDEPKPTFPFLCLTVSGGHTQMVWVKDYFAMEVLGQTQDDAVGEAFDKIAKLMGLSYPGGCLIDHYAQKGNAHAFSFPSTHVPGLDFSFSGIKAAFSRFIQSKSSSFVAENLPDICASIQATLVDMLCSKLIKAAKTSNMHRIALAGGVAANRYLRKQLAALANQYGWELFIPAMAYCTDNAAMVAMAAYYKYHKGDFADLTIRSFPRMGF